MLTEILTKDEIRLIVREELAILLAAKLETSPPNKEGPDRLLTVDEVARFLGVSKARVYQLSRDGVFKDLLVTVGQRQYRYHPDVLTGKYE